MYFLVQLLYLYCKSELIGHRKTAPLPLLHIHFQVHGSASQVVSPFLKQVNAFHMSAHLIKVIMPRLPAVKKKGFMFGLHNSLSQKLSSSSSISTSSHHLLLIMAICKCSVFTQITTASARTTWSTRFTAEGLCSGAFPVMIDKVEPVENARRQPRCCMVTSGTVNQAAHDNTARCTKGR